MSNPTPSEASGTIDDDVSVSDLADHIQTLTDRIDEHEADIVEKDQQIEDLRANLKQKDARIENLEQRTEELAMTTDEEKAHREAITRKAQACDERIDELQARELEKDAHLLAEHVDQDRITVEGNTLERITKDDGQIYFRLPGEDDALGRGGAVVHSTGDFLPIQRLARYDVEMLASVTNRKPDELADKAWRNAPFRASGFAASTKRTFSCVSRWSTDTKPACSDSIPSQERK